MTDLSTIRRVALEVAAWCKTMSKTRVGWKLWTPEIRPPKKLIQNVGGETTVISVAERIEVVRQVVETRRTFLAETNRLDSVDSPPLAGRYLVYHPELSLSDGASEVGSSGLLDSHSQPAWDLWLAYGQLGERSPGLLCWIPMQFETQINSGMAVNADESLEWVETFAKG
jgi:hypothetical protein